MGQQTGISWCDHTFNPWWGCVKVSPACKHCYAETWAKRTGHRLWGHGAPRRFFGADHWRQPERWNRAAAREGVRRRVFCASMADVFEAGRHLDGERRRLWDLIERTADGLDWLLLTKRPELVRELVPAAWLDDWPAHVWIGTTVENQHWAERRLPHLVNLPAAVRFVSCEPLLGRVQLLAVQLPGEFLYLDVLAGEMITYVDGVGVERVPAPGRVSWVITGGESGPKARATHPEWVRFIRDQCQATGTAYHHKQWGQWLPGSQEQGGYTNMFYVDKPGGIHRWDEIERSYRIKDPGLRLLDGVLWDQVPGGEH